MVNHRVTTINCRGRLLDLSTPVIMAIVNLSPDSFHHSVKGDANILNHVEKCIKEGADIIDLGGMSTRPGSLEVDIEDEWKRLFPALHSIRKAFPDSLISVDSYRSEIFRRANDEGIDMVNDISGGLFDPMMFEVIAKLELPYILMHNRGKPEVMQQLTEYSDLLMDIYDYFVGKIHLLEAKGVKDIIVDPGFGFSKTIHQNYQLLKHLDTFCTLGYPVMVGISRKGMMYKLLETGSEDVLAVNTALHFKALELGASILRVHDVREAVQCVRVFKAWQSA